MIKPAFVLLVSLLVFETLLPCAPSAASVSANHAPFESALYSFEDQSGPQLVDSMGGTTAVVTGNPQFNVAGSYDSALGFRGASQMTIDYRGGLNPIHAFSVSFWFRANSFNSFDRLVDTSGSVGVISQGIPF